MPNGNDSDEQFPVGTFTNNEAPPPISPESSFNSSGHELPQTSDVNSGSSLTHIVWLSHAKFLEAWYGTETIVSAAYVDTGSNGTGMASAQQP
jgi:hypothetical protein